MFLVTKVKTKTTIGPLLLRHRLFYTGGLKDAVIGQVYVKGPDDSDELNKVYSLVDCTSPYFDVSKYGLIKMKEGTPAGDYTLKVNNVISF